MSALKKLFKHTFIYGVATVLPRILSFILTPFYIDQLPSEAEFGKFSVIFAYIVFGNVVLSYGMETAFFRFMNKGQRKSDVQSTALTSLAITSVVFGVLAFTFSRHIAQWLELKLDYVLLAIGILVLDALVVIPFAWLRNQEMPLKYSVIKILNVSINFSMNLILFLVISQISLEESEFPGSYMFEDKVNYIFISNLIASLVTLLTVLPLYRKIGLKFNIEVWRRMMKYAMPVLIAGIAFSINEVADKIILNYLLPQDTAKEIVGIYAACYKMGVFMTLFITAFKLGVEPFFFSNADKDDAKKTYASILLYFTIFGSFILLSVVAYSDLLKYILMPKAAYWEALWVVPFILLANLCLGIYHNLSVWYKITDRTRYGAYISVAGACITLALNFLLINKIGYKASAIATLSAYATMMMVSYYYGRKHYPIPYNLKKIGAYLLTSIIMAILSFYVFDRNLYIGTLFVLLFLLMIILLEKNELKKILKRS
ncbi:polysaccharide biosynthesis C-terminal domain-containing protein [Zhouia spongiae]|uniref:Polysaccharide biosynthesis C-terminal domain-containing protein n=1 Tax=Zhouia spongiae TaxID=2202721 RepID=A0ABY3YPC5_9FLAO|nr:polysaccharide biosynthesis C-terminal domain-containing protein [Zhouia spongiae]UNY99680.1 polysaccharide biosynthesis C-terminal domain-containing protein [Zhouia spongiae]